MKNTLLAKSKQINLCGVIGMALALLGLLLPSIKVSYMGMGMSGTMFEATAWTVLPLLLIVGAGALYGLKYDTAGFLASIAAALVYFIVICICRAIAKGQVGSFDVGIHYTIGFYFAFFGFMIAVAAPWINNMIFKPQDRQPRQQYDPNMIQGGPVINQQNSYMNQAQPNMNPYSKTNQQMGQQTAQYVQQNPYMNQGQPQANPYMNQGMPQQNPYMNQANPYLNQAPQQANSYMNQMQNQVNQMQNQANQFMDQAPQQANPYLNQMQEQAKAAVDEALNLTDQAQDAVDQAVQNVDVPNINRDQQ